MTAAPPVGLQELLANMEADMEGEREGGADAPEDAAAAARWRCASTSVRDKVDFVQALDQC